MLILITGVPGSGKTLFAVSELLNGQFKDRPLYVNGVPDLLVPHIVVSDEDIERWYDGGMPDAQTGKPSIELKNAVIVVDEVQRIARPRSASSKVPEWIAKLETHRHQGCDFIMITQHPQLLDVNIRRLVGRHLHVRRTFGRGAAVVYEWDHCENTGNVKSAATRLWRYPKAAFKLYKSSELHTKAGGKLPIVVWVAVIAALVTPVLIWRGSDRVLHGFAQAGDKKLSAAVPGGANARLPGAPGVRGASGGAGQPGQAAQHLSASELTVMQRARFGGMAHTAPYYDDLTKPQRVPLPAACVRNASKGCLCYSQDGTLLNVESAWCSYIVDRGIFLDFVPDSNGGSAASGGSRESAADGDKGRTDAPGLTVVDGVGWRDPQGYRGSSR